MLIMRKTEKGDNSVMHLRILPKVNQVIYTLDTICDPNIMTLAQAVLENLVYKLIMRKTEKGDNYSHGFREFYQKFIRSSTP